VTLLVWPVNLAWLTEEVEEISQGYARRHGINRDSTWFMLKLQEEVGELTQAFLMRSGQARSKGCSAQEIEERFRPRLAALPCDLVWATTWMDDANETIAPRIGLPQLAVVIWPEPTDTDEHDERNGLHWKTRALVDWAAGRPFAWVDDEITDTDRAWVSVHHPGHALLHRVDPRLGLTDADYAALKDWLHWTRDTPDVARRSPTAAAPHRDHPQPRRANRGSQGQRLARRGRGTDHQPHRGGEEACGPRPRRPQPPRIDIPRPTRPANRSKPIPRLAVSRCCRRHVRTRSSRCVHANVDRIVGVS